MVDQATRDAAPAQGRLALAGQQQREDGQRGYTTFRMRMLICNRCGFVMHFALGRSMFVPG